MNEVICAIEGRRSIRSYRTDPVPEEKLEAVVKAGLMAPSAMNQQSWHFVVISGKGAERYRTYCMEKLGRDPYYGAPAMILVFGKKDAIAPVCDGSLAIGNLLLAAKALGLGSCWIHCVNDLFKEEAAAAEWGVPAGYRPVGSVALGFPAGEAPAAKPRKEGTVTQITE